MRFAERVCVDFYRPSFSHAQSPVEIFMVVFARLSRVVFSVVVAVLFGSSAAPAHAVPVYNWVTVGNPGNANDTINTGTTPNYGAVATSFRIMKYEFTNQQYTDFLNSVAATDAYSLYNTSMSSNPRGGIIRSGVSGSYTYAVKTSMADKPVNYVSWFDAARVSNWLMNGATSSSSTETGAYTLENGQVSGTAPAVNPAATFSIPTEGQWYKTAYYNPTLNDNAGGYRVYGNGFDETPGSVSANEFGVGSAGGAGNFANYNLGASWNGLAGDVTTVGTNGGASFYGAFDMSGNIFEWNDLTGVASSSRGRRGGALHNDAFFLTSTGRVTGDPSLESGSIGFRLVAVPEPTTHAMALAGLACGGFSMWRRRKRA